MIPKEQAANDAGIHKKDTDERRQRRRLSGYRWGTGLRVLGIVAAAHYILYTISILMNPDLQQAGAPGVTGVLLVSGALISAVILMLFWFLALVIELLADASSPHP